MFSDIFLDICSYIFPYFLSYKKPLITPFTFSKRKIQCRFHKMIRRTSGVSIKEWTRKVERPMRDHFTVHEDGRLQPGAFKDH